MELAGNDPRRATHLHFINNELKSIIHYQYLVYFLDICSKWVIIEFSDQTQYLILLGRSCKICLILTIRYCYIWPLFACKRMEKATQTALIMWWNSMISLIFSCSSNNPLLWDVQCTYLELRFFALSFLISMQLLIELSSRLSWSAWKPLWTVGLRPRSRRGWWANWRNTRNRRTWTREHWRSSDRSWEMKASI